MRAHLALPGLLVAAIILSAPAAVLVGPAGQAGATTASYSPPTGAGVMHYMEDWVMTHPLRMESLPTNVKARNDLAANLSSFGLWVKQENYGSGVNVLAIQNGTTKPNEWIVLSAHYDTIAGTIYGAWDDGAGVALLLEMARSGATRTFNRTIVYAFFDEEETGLYGSEAFVNAHGSKVVDNLNFDPPGLNWPCADAAGFLSVKVSLNDAKTAANVAGYRRIKSAVIAGLDAAGVPAAQRDMAPDLPIATVFGFGLAGTSDHYNFDQQDIPNAFIGSLPTTVVGGARVLNYPLHTPADDLATMIARCGSKSLLEQAFGVQAVIAKRAVEYLDGP